MKYTANMRIARNSAETAFPQDFHTRKLGEIPVFYTVAVHNVSGLMILASLNESHGF